MTRPQPIQILIETVVNTCLGGRSAWAPLMSWFSRVAFGFVGRDASGKSDFGVRLCARRWNRSSLDRVTQSEAGQRMDKVSASYNGLCQRYSVVFLYERCC